MVQQRDSAKAKRPAGRSNSGARATAAAAKPRPAAGAGVGAAASVGEVETLRAQVADLERQLKLAQGRVADLEQLRTQALNRIDWAIDSLHNVLEGEV